jgi:hypothetical protein
MSRHYTQIFPFETVDRRIHRPAHASGVLRDSLHDRLEIGGRARNYSQDLRGCRLLLERLGHLSVRLRERTVLLLEFRKEADVLDRNHGLIRERL